MDKDEKELREILKRERGELNCWDKHHPRLKQRIANLILTNHQFELKFMKKTDIHPYGNTKWIKEVLSIESSLYMNRQGLYEWSYHYFNVVPNS
jgi:hypothetical protein